MNRLLTLIQDPQPQLIYHHNPSVACVKAFASPRPAIDNLTFVSSFRIFKGQEIELIEGATNMHWRIMIQIFAEQSLVRLVIHSIGHFCDGNQVIAQFRPECATFKSARLALIAVNQLTGGCWPTCYHSASWVSKNFWLPLRLQRSDLHWVFWIALDDRQSLPW